MSELAAVIRRFPLHELTIRRLHARVPEFRSLCEDYAAARSALEHWQADLRKVQDFQHLSEEIEAEMSEFIQASLNSFKREQAQED